MSKTTSEYFDLLKQELQTFPELASLASEVSTTQELLTRLSTPSKAATWDLMTWVQATGLSAVDMELEHTKAVILAEIPKRKYGYTEWYVEQAKKFQFGHEVVWNNGLFSYEEIDEEARVIAQAAVVPLAHGIRLKVARLVSGELGPATVDQMDALKDYFNDRYKGIKPAGVRVVITTGEADLLKLSIRVVRNPQVLSSTGESILQQGVFPVNQVVNNYAQFLPFNGEFNISALEDRIQEVDGVIDVEIDSAESKYGDFDYAPIDLKYTADAGYMKIDPAFPLSSTIQYLI
jgi:hypothetical protein